MFSCEFCENFKNTFFTEHLWTTASEQNMYFSQRKKIKKWIQSYWANLLVSFVQKANKNLKNISLLWIMNSFKTDDIASHSCLPK